MSGAYHVGLCITTDSIEHNIDSNYNMSTGHPEVDDI